MRKRPLFLVACVFLTGVAYGRFQRMELPILLSVWLIYELYRGLATGRMGQWAGRSVFLLSAFLLGSMHMNSELAFRNRYLSKIQDSSMVTVWGEIYKTESNRFYLTDCGIRLNEGVTPCNDVVVYTSSNDYQVGQILKVVGELHMFTSARNEGGFDSRAYYFSQKIDFAVYATQTLLLEDKSHGVKAAVLELRENVMQVYQECIDGKTAGFLTGMVLGDKAELDADLKRLLTNGGIAHILAISGLHMSMIGRGFYRFLRNRSWGFGIAGIVAGIILCIYCFMTGNGMSAIRAVGMMLLFFLAQGIGRSYDMLNSLGAMVLYLLWENPFLLEYSGFWLSVLALLGVGFVGDTFSRVSKRMSGLFMSIGITWTTLPVVAYCYYEIPLYSPMVNFLLLPILTPVFALALIGGLMGLVWTGGAKMVLLPCQWGLCLYEWVCQGVEELPFAMMITGQPTEAVMVAYYVVLLMGTLGVQRMIVKRLSFEEGEDALSKKQMQKWYRFGTAVTMSVCGACLLIINYAMPPEAEITFLDVGQGDGIYICGGDGTNYFIDGGSVSEEQLGEYCILPFLKSNNIEGIDYWFVSHTDKDHVTGLLEVLKSGYSIQHIVLAEGAPQDANLEELQEVAEEAGVPIVYMEPGEYVASKQVRITCLYPEANIGEIHPQIAEDRNEASLVLELLIDSFEGNKDFRGLFAGDISAEVEEWLLQERRVQKVWLYKAIHHGSKHSNSQALMQWLTPEVVVVSCGKNNVYGHPALEAVQNMERSGADIYYTMDAGQITIRSNGKEIEIIEYLKKE